MSAGIVFDRIISALDQSGIPYMLTGSFASSFHGSPRATQDIDIVIAPTREGMAQLLHALPENRYYVSAEAAYEALSHRGQFNVIDFETGWKVDFILRKARPFSLEEFQRKTEIDLLGRKVHIASAEDVLIAKLEWSAAGSSQRQIEDAAGILRSRGPDLDKEYLQRWIKELALDKQWEAAKILASK